MKRAKSVSEKVLPSLACVTRFTRTLALSHSARSLARLTMLHRLELVSLKREEFLSTQTIAHLLRNLLTCLLSLRGAKRRSNPIHIENNEISATHVALCDNIGSYFRHWCSVFRYTSLAMTKNRFTCVTPKISMDNLLEFSSHSFGLGQYNKLFRYLLLFCNQHCYLLIAFPLFHPSRLL